MSAMKMAIFGRAWGCKLALAAVALSMFAPSSAVARTVTVASCDRSTGATTLAISAAEAGDGAKALVAAWSPSDVGNAVTNAREPVYVGAVSAAETEKSFTIPSAWREKAGFVRFYLMAGVPPYDTRVASLYAPSGSTAWIDTGFVPNANSDIRVTLAYGNNTFWIPFGIGGRCYLFPQGAGDLKNYWVDFMGAVADYSNTYGGSNGTSQAPHGNKKHEFRLNAKGAHIDGICYASFNPASLTNSTAISLSLFGRRDNSSGAIQTGRMGDGTIFSAQLPTTPPARSRRAAWATVRSSPRSCARTARWCTTTCRASRTVWRRSTTARREPSAPSTEAAPTRQARRSDPTRRTAAAWSPPQTRWRSAPRSRLIRSTSVSRR